MSNRKTILWLVLGSLLLATVHFFLSMQGMGTALVQRGTLLDISVENAKKIEIVREYGPAMTFVKDLEWAIEKPFKADADESAILKLLDALCLSPIAETYTEQDLAKFGRTRDDYGLGVPFLRVKVETAGNVQEATFGIKTPAADGVFAAVEGDASVYVAGTNVLAAANIQPDGFRKRSLCSTRMESVDSFDLKRAKGDFLRFSRNGGAWVVSYGAGEAVRGASIAKVDKFLSGVFAAAALDFVWPVGSENESPIATTPLLAGFGLDPDNAVTLSLHSPGRPDEQIVFGKDAKNGYVYALIQNARAIATVPRQLKESALEGDFADTHLFPASKDKIRRITITDGDATYILARNDKDIWRFDSPVDVACDDVKIQSLLSSILKLETSAKAEEGILVSVGNDIPAATIGKESLFSDYSIEDLRSLEILKIDPSTVKRLTATGMDGDKPVSVAFDADKHFWNVESQSRGLIPIQNSIDGILEELSGLKAEKIVKLKVSSTDLRRYGLEKPRYTIAVDVAGAMRRNLQIGEKSQGGNFATLGSLDSVFILSDRTVHRLTAPLAAQ